MVVVITGASSGIGKALAEQLSQRGARLVLAARRGERLEELNARLGGRHLVVRTDVAVPADCGNLIDRAIECHGRIDTLVCNAGYGIVRSVARTSYEEMRQIFDTNFFGTSELVRLAVPHMKRQAPRDGHRGHVMIVSSILGRIGMPNSGAYSATKFAQLGLAQALRVELSPQRIAVTTVHPVRTESEFFEAAAQRSGARMSRRKAFEVSQTPETVARKMTRAIERPPRELWPSRPSRWAANLGVMLPVLSDWMLGAYRKGREGDKSAH